MPAKTPKEVFVNLLSDARNGTERSAKVFQELSQAARNVQNQFGLGRQFLQVADERLGVQIVDGADANGSGHEILT